MSLRDKPDVVAAVNPFLLEAEMPDKGSGETKVESEVEPEKPSF